MSFGYGGDPVIRDLTTTIMRGDKVGIIGPNAAGKTTLIRLLLGEVTPIAGTIRLGTRLEIAYFDQLKATLDEEKTVQQNISDYDMIPINGQARHVIGYLQDFLFAPERSRSLVKYLSGGERSRLLLAKLFTKPSNLLVLDEPTNDLDVETLELLGIASGRVPGDGASGQPRSGILERRRHQHAGDRARRPGQGVRRRLRRLRETTVRAGFRGIEDIHRCVSANRQQRHEESEEAELQGATRAGITAGRIEALEAEIQRVARGDGRPGVLQARRRVDRSNQRPAGRARNGAGDGLRAVGAVGGVGGLVETTRRFPFGADFFQKPPSWKKNPLF